MGDSGIHPGPRQRLRRLLKWALPSFLALLVFAAGLVVGNRFLPNRPTDHSFAKALRSPDSGSPLIQNSLGIPLRPLPSGEWVADALITESQFESLTGSPPHPSSSPPSPDRPASQITHAQANAFCKILTDRELAAGLLPVTHLYRLPTQGEVPQPNGRSTAEWIDSPSSRGIPMSVASAVLKADLPLYAPDADTFPGGWTRWHESLLSTPSAALHLPEDAAPRIELAGSLAGPRRRLIVRASDHDPAAAAELANRAAASLKNQCNALAAQRRETEWNYLRAEVDSAESRNAHERAQLLDLMARYDIADSLDLPAWFVGHNDLGDDLGLQTAKNNLARLKALLAHLENPKSDAPPDVTQNPGISDAANAVAHLQTERKLLEVEVAQAKIAGTQDSDPALVAFRAKISLNEEAIQSARQALLEDVTRELKVADNLLTHLQSIKRTGTAPPATPTTGQPRAEAVLESRIAHADKQLRQLQNLRGDPLYDFALALSKHESPLRALVPEYIKHREIKKEIQESIATLDQEIAALAPSPTAPEPQAPDTTPAPPAPESDPENPSEPDREPADPEEAAADQLAKLPAQLEAKRKLLESAKSRAADKLKSAEADARIAEHALADEIARLVAELTDSRERDRRELDYFIEKRSYLLGWYRLADLRAELAQKKAELARPPDAVTITAPASPEQAAPGENPAFVAFVRDRRAISAHPEYRNPNLHFRVVLAVAN